jgi:hypothetical protein
LIVNNRSTGTVQCCSGAENIMLSSHSIFLIYGFDPGNPYTQGFVKFRTGIRGYALRIPII